MYEALKGDPFYVALEQSAKGDREAMVAYYLFSIAEARRYGRVCVLPEGLIGISVWSVPLNSKLTQEKSIQKSEFIKSTMGETAFTRYSNICASMARATKSVTDHGDWYLSIAGVRPEHQGKGFGKQMIEPVLREADRLGVASYLETFTEKSMPFYERLGYRQVASFEEPTSAARYWLMRRCGDF